MKTLWRVLSRFGVWVPVLLFIWWCTSFDQPSGGMPHLHLEKTIPLFASPDSTSESTIRVKKGQRIVRDMFQSGWVKIRTSDRKEGWLLDNVLTGATRKFESAEYSLSQSTTLYASPSFSAEAVVELNRGTKLKELVNEGRWRPVKIHDGTKGWIYALPQPFTIWHVPINHFIPGVRGIFHNPVYYQIDHWLFQQFAESSVQTRGMGFSRVLFLGLYGLLLLVPYLAAMLIQISLARIEVLSNRVLRWFGILIVTLLFFVWYYVVMLLPPANEHMTAVAFLGIVVMLWGYTVPFMFDPTIRCYNCHKLGTMKVVGGGQLGTSHGEIVTTLTGGGMSREVGREKYTEKNYVTTYKCDSCGAVYRHYGSSRTKGWS